MSSLTSGRREPCKDAAGGIKELWLATFVDYPKGVIVGYKSMLLTSFPDTQMYRFYGQEGTFDETFREDAYEQEIKIKLIKQRFEDIAILDAVMKNKCRAIVVDYMGKIKVAGLHNGLDVDVTASQGGTRFDFNGYELTLIGLEPYSAPFLSSFPGSGFVKEGLTFGCLLASSDRPASLGVKVSDCNAAL